MSETRKESVLVPAAGATLPGVLAVPERALGVVLFAHGSGSGRLSPRNNFVAEVLQRSGVGTLLLDLLTEQEDAALATRFDIELLTRRLVDATHWMEQQPGPGNGLPIGYFGASTGAAAALQAAATNGGCRIAALVSRGGRPDLAMPVLGRVRAPTLLIVGGRDYGVIELNQQAYDRLRAPKRLVVVPGATHLFPEPGALEEVARLAAEWFARHLAAAVRAPETTTHPGAA